MNMNWWNCNLLGCLKMHGLSYAFVEDLVTLRTREASEHAAAPRIAEARASRASETLLKFENFLGRPGQGEQMGARYSDPRGLMRKMAARVKRQWDWQDSLDGQADSNANPDVPAGYTYLLQLIAHDILQSSISFGALGPAPVAIENAQVTPLILSTIYGSGPDTHRHAYVFSEACRTQFGKLPRTYLRVGEMQSPPVVLGCPLTDIGRGRPIGVPDSGLESDTSKDWRTEILLADTRNDDHVIIAQLAVLFHKFHNWILSIIEATHPSGTNAHEASRNFIAARAVVTLIYQKLILEDVLKRILSEDAFQYYVTDRKPRLSSSSTPSYEFGLGAFRFGHAMIRNRYAFNDFDGHGIKQFSRDALNHSSLRFPWKMPLIADYLVDWGLFFDLSRPEANLSRRIGPLYSDVVRDQFLFPALIEGRDHTGLPARDFASAASVPIWSVPVLIEKIEIASPEIGTWLAGSKLLYSNVDPLTSPIGSWLGERKGIYESSEDRLSDQDIEELASDPPLPFFVLFEAACQNAAGQTSEEMFAGGGRRLGALGSIIITETILGILDPHQDHHIHEPLNTQIPLALSRLRRDKNLLGNLVDIRSMPDLIQKMREADIVA